MVTKLNPEYLFKDAKDLQAMALKELEAGNIRDAAEKAWGATLRAIDGLILARTGQEPVRSDISTRRLHELAVRDHEVEERLVGRYHTRSDYLHGSCFYTGVCEPTEDIERRIKETAEFIDDAKKLAGLRRE